MGAIIVKVLGSYFIRLRKYGDTYPSEPKERMRYITKLSRDEVLEKLKYRQTNDIFDFEFKREKNDVYLLTITGIGQEYLYCSGAVKYKILVTSEQEGTSVWLFMISYNSRMAVRRYAWELKGFLEKKIQAIRVE
ncbi:MAG: hypothetical protein J6D08_13265 [Lachnospiraceae bacterium]|nr:hypothetical protein [Lachnospiraceae bacterium]